MRETSHTAQTSVFVPAVWRRSKDAAKSSPKGGTDAAIRAMTGAMKQMSAYRRFIAQDGEKSSDARNTPHG